MTTPLNKNDCQGTFDKKHDFKQSIVGKLFYTCLYCGQTREIMHDHRVSIVKEVTEIIDATK